MAPRQSPRTVHVALLRGVNVGGRNRLPMSVLSWLLSDAGALDVRTYIQSGNALFTVAPSRAAEVAHALAEGIERKLGFRPVVVVRTASKLARVARRHPLDGPDVDPGTLHVGFLSARPSRARVAALDPDRSPPDAVLVRGSEAWLRLPNGGGGTRYTNAYLDATLGATSTIRNWRTVLALAGLAGGGEGKGRA